MPSSISDLDGLGPGFAVKLKKVGIRTTEKLLESAKSLRGRQKLAEETDIDERQLLPVSHLIVFMNETGTAEIYTLPLHDALPIFKEVIATCVMPLALQSL